MKYLVILCQCISYQFQYFSNYLAYKHTGEDPMLISESSTKYTQYNNLVISGWNSMTIACGFELFILTIIVLIIIHTRRNG